jgi:hypothetical protein
MLAIQAAGSSVIGWLDDNAAKPCADEYTRTKEYDFGRSGINSRLIHGLSLTGSPRAWICA